MKYNLDEIQVVHQAGSLNDAVNKVASKESDFAFFQAFENEGEDHLALLNYLIAHEFHKWNSIMDKQISNKQKLEHLCVLSQLHQQIHSLDQGYEIRHQSLKILPVTEWNPHTDDLSCDQLRILVTYVQASSVIVDWKHNQLQTAGPGIGVVMRGAWCKHSSPNHNSLTPDPKNIFETIMRNVGQMFGQKEVKPLDFPHRVMYLGDISPQKQAIPKV